VFVPQQLDELEKMFKNLLDTSKKEYSQMPIEHGDFYYDAYHPFHLAPFLLLRIIIDSYVVHATLVWPHKIKDKQSLAKTYTVIFGKLASMQLLLSKFLLSVGTRALAYVSNMIGLSTGSKLSHVECMSVCLRLYEGFEMKQQVELIFDLLWEINSDILDLVYQLEYPSQQEKWKQLMEMDTYNVYKPSDTYRKILNENKNLRIKQMKITSY
jgi:hypothetical protein